MKNFLISKRSKRSLGETRALTSWRLQELN